MPTYPGPPAPPPQPGMIWNATALRWEWPTSATGLSGPGAVTTTTGPGTPGYAGDATHTTLSGGTPLVDTRTGQPIKTDSFVSDPKYGGAGITAQDYLQGEGHAASGPPSTGGLSDGTRPLVDTRTGEVVTPAGNGQFDANGASAELNDPAAADKAAAAKDAENAQKLRDALQAERNPAPGVAPQVAAPAPIKAAQVGSVAPVTATAPTAPKAAAPTPVSATAPKAAVAGAPVQITTPQIQGAQVKGTNLAQATQANAATLDKAPQQEFRDQQSQLSSAVLAAALGQGGPSAAELQTQRQMQQAQNEQRAFAASTHGYGALAAQHQAGRNIAKLQADAVLQGALLRAKETETARGQAIEATGQARSQDIGIAGTEAGFQQGANLQNSQLATAVSQSNAGLEANREIENAKLNQATQTTNAGNFIDVGKSNQDAQLRTALANAANENQTNIVGATEANKVAMGNQDADLRTALANAQNETQTNIVGATEANKVAMSNQDAELKAKLAQAGFDQQAILQMSDQDLKAKLANAGFQLTQEQIDVQRKEAANNAAIDMTKALLNYRTGQAQQDGQRAALAAQIEQARRSGNVQLVATLLTVGGALLAGSLGGGGGSGGEPGATSGQPAGVGSTPEGTSYGSAIVDV